MEPEAPIFRASAPSLALSVFRAAVLLLLTRFIFGPLPLFSGNPDTSQHWAFQPLVRVAPPASPERQSPWKNPIDAFVASSLTEHRLSLAPEASPRTLIRRVSFDLIGLPPSPDDLARLLVNWTTGSYDGWVDQLLSSPHFGERWGRHWLDLARYADSHGYERDSDRPHVWRYRDFVINAFNTDMPFDQFVKWQLAGDEIEPTSDAARIATAFIGLGPEMETDTKLVDELARYRYADLDDMISTTSQAMLGLTVGCARCHDHKYDPIPTRDYYQMLCAFTPLERRDIPLVSETELAAYRQRTNTHAQQLTLAKKKLEGWIASLKQEVVAQHPETKAPGWKGTREELGRFLTQEQQQAWSREEALVKRLEGERPIPLPTATIMWEGTNSPANFLMKRGDPTLPTDRVELGFLSVLMRGRGVGDYLSSAAEPSKKSDASRRKSRAALSHWMTDVDHGAGALLARVIVNRMWQHHFGEGLVKTPSDFGTQGERPTHPQLLEWLAGELVRQGWKLKPIHRLMVTSAAYRQRFVELDAAHRDSERRLLRGRPAQRLEAEILRDGILAVSGCLNLAAGGPGVKAPIPAELNSAYNTQNPYPKDVKDSPETWRRSVYLFSKRSLRHPLMEVFDGADPNAVCSRRFPTTVAPQALALLNDPWIRARANDFAFRIEREAGKNEVAQIRRAYLLSLGREPSAEELERGHAFVRLQQTTRAQRHEADSDHSAWVDFCQVLFGLNEFIYID